MIKFLRILIRTMILRIKFRQVQFSYIGHDCHFMSFTSKFPSAENIILGCNVHIGPSAMLDGAGGISIGDGSILAPHVHIYSRTHNFDENLQALPFDNIMLTAPVNIGRYVWIGTKVIILPGVNIGDGAVIGAGAVVSRDVPSCAVVVGNPARVVKYRDQERFAELTHQKAPFVYQRFGRKKSNRSKKLQTKVEVATQDE